MHSISIATLINKHTVYACNVKNGYTVVVTKGVIAMYFQTKITPLNGLEWSENNSFTTISYLFFDSVCVYVWLPTAHQSGFAVSVF